MVDTNPCLTSLFSYFILCVHFTRNVPSTVSDDLVLSDDPDALSTMTVSDTEDISNSNLKPVRPSILDTLQPHKSHFGQSNMDKQALEAPEKNGNDLEKSSNLPDEIPLDLPPQHNDEPLGPSEEQIRIKTEASGMDQDAIDMALKNHANNMVTRARSKRSLETSGLSFTEISRRTRIFAAQGGNIEIIDFETLGIDEDNFDFSSLSRPDFQPDYLEGCTPLEVPQDIQDLHNLPHLPKYENGEPKRPIGPNGKPKPINRWWRQEKPAKKRLSDTLVNTSTESSASSTIPPDKDPKGSTKTFTHFLMKPNRRSAALLELSTLNPEGAIIFHDTPQEEKEKRERRNLIERVKRTLNESNSKSDHLVDLLGLISDNPTSFFAVKDLIDSLVQQGITDVTQIVNRISFDDNLQRPVLLPQGQLDGNIIHPNPEVEKMLNVFDAEQAPREKPSIFTKNISSEETTSINGPSHSSTPIGNANASFFPSGPSKRRRNDSNHVTLLEVSNRASPMKPDEYLARHKISSTYLAKISDFPIQGRKTVGNWKALVRKRLIEKPLPLNYHTRYNSNPGFLSKSFKGEALPGVFRPCSSGMPESDAIKAFRQANNDNPPTLVDLNTWIKFNYPPENLDFDPDIHSIECEGYNLDFWAEIKDLNLSRSGAGLNTSGIIPHCPMDMITTDQFFKLHMEHLEPLRPFVADTLLTTLGPSFGSRRNFMWWSIPVPQYGGDLVLKDALFDHNAMAYVINNQTQVGRCAICKGLLLTPHHVTFLAYFFPDGLETNMINASIVQLWKAQKIAVCFIHAITDAVKKPNRQL